LFIFLPTAAAAAAAEENFLFKQQSEETKEIRMVCVRIISTEKPFSVEIQEIQKKFR